MADTCEESSSEGSDNDNFSIYSERSTSDENEQNEEASASFSLMRRHKSHSTVTVREPSWSTLDVYFNNRLVLGKARLL